MSEPSESGERDVYSVRVSFRSTAHLYRKLVQIAKAKKWINARGKPNISAVLNFVVENFDLGTVERNKKGK